MPFSNLWLFIFFFCLVLIGIDSQFGIVENLGYYVQTWKIKYKGRRIKPEMERLLVCFVVMCIGVPISTRAGQYIISVMNNFSFFIPLAFTNLFNIFIFVKW
jgi:SNF family Na+-dependent transporter